MRIHGLTKLGLHGPERPPTQHLRGRAHLCLWQRKQNDFHSFLGRFASIDNRRRNEGPTISRDQQVVAVRDPCGLGTFGRKHLQCHEVSVAKFHDVIEQRLPFRYKRQLRIGWSNTSTVSDCSQAPSWATTE